MPRINAVSFHDTRSIEAICRTVLAAGFNSLELSRLPFYVQLVTTPLRRRFRQWAEQQGLQLYGFDCWVDVEPYTRRPETLADFRRAIEWAAELDLGMLITHDPWASVNAHRRPSQCLVQCVDLFRAVAEQCATRGIRLVFEPHPDTLSMVDSWAIDFIDAVGEDFDEGRVGILYDCCHYGVGQPENYLQAIRRLGSRITHLHFSDGDRQTYALHLPLGDGSLDLPGMVAALRDIEYQGTLTCDLYNYPLLEDGARRNAPQIEAVEQQLGLTRP